MGEARGSEPGAPGAPTPRPRAPQAPAPELRGAAHLRRRGHGAALTEQGQGHCNGARPLLAAARRSTRSSRAERRSPHRRAALPPRRASGVRESGVGGAWWAPARGRLQAGTQGAAARKSYLRVIVGRAGSRGDPLALGEPALVAAICAVRGARAGGGTCRAGARPRRAAGGGAAPQWRRRGEERPRRAPGGARSLRIPRPGRRHLAIASPPGSAAAPPPASPSGGRAECVPMATGARGGRGRAPLLARPGAAARARGWRPPGVRRGGRGAWWLKSPGFSRVGFEGAQRGEKLSCYSKKEGSREDAP